MKFEFLIPQRPLSLQAKGRNLKLWKNFVREQAARVWNGSPIQTGDLQLTLVYLCGLAPPDTDNIVKPIQDALAGLVFSDDALIADVEGHRRALNGAFDLTRLPQLLISAIGLGQECVYVRVTSSLPLEDYL